MHYNPIAETNNFIVLDKFTKYYELNDAPAGYQTEAALEHEFIRDLVNQGYENPTNLNTPEAMLANIRVQLQTLNDMTFSDAEWVRFVLEYLDKPGDSLVEKTRKIHDNHIYDFVFDDGHIQNIYLVDKKNIARNKVQVISQFEQKGTQANRYDVTILVNGLPLVQVELKKEVLLSVKRLIRCIATPKRVLTARILSISTCRFLSYQTALTAVILQIQLSGTKTVLTLP